MVPYPCKKGSDVWAHILCSVYKGSIARDPNQGPILGILDLSPKGL